MRTKTISEDTIAEFNKNLCEKYPFLIPKDWMGHSMAKDREWKYSFTWRDEVSFGWLHLFDLMCEELLAAIENTSCYKTFELDEVKSKYGELRIYSNGGNKQTDRIIDKWCAISGYVCEGCGKPDVRVTKGWVMPICYECWFKRQNKTYEEFLTKTERVQYPPTLKITKWVKDSSRPMVEEIDLEIDFQHLVDDYNAEKGVDL